MRIIESIRNYILKCPYLAEGRVNVDFLGAEATEYSIDATPTQPIVKTYADGGTIRQFDFTFSSVELYGRDVLANMENSGFYEDFAKWIEEQNKLGNLPILDKGMTAQRIEILTNGYLFDNSMEYGRYQIQLRLLYYKD